MVQPRSTGEVDTRVRPILTGTTGPPLGGSEPTTGLPLGCSRVTRPTSSAPVQGKDAGVVPAIRKRPVRSLAPNTPALTERAGNNVPPLRACVMGTLVAHTPCRPVVGEVSVARLERVTVMRVG